MRMSKNYYQPEIETMPVEQIQALQSKRLTEQVRFVYDNVKFYHDKMDEAGVKPEDIKGIEDLHKLPFIDKNDLRDQYPYGLLGVPLSECVRIQSTSGTTGRRVVAFYTQEDIDVWEECCARAIVAAGGTKDDVCHVLWLRTLYGWSRFKRRLAQGRVPDASDVFGKYGAAVTVYDGFGFDHSVLYTVLRRKFR